MFSSLVVLLFVLLQSCESTELIQASLDRGHVEYEYTFQNGTFTRRVKSPSVEEFGFNLGMFFATGGAGAGSGSTFFENKFTNTNFLATASNSHGPAYSQNESSELNTTYNAKASTSSQNISFMGGLEFIKKGGEGEHLYYLEVPLYATYSINLSGNGKVFGSLGPYFGYGFGSAFGDHGGFKPFDAGASAMAGYKMYNSFSFSLGYDYGLVNISNNSGGFNSETAANRTISLNIAYPLNKLMKRK